MARDRSTGAARHHALRRVGALRCALAVVALAAGLIGVNVGSAVASEGTVNFIRHARSSFDSQLTGSTAQQRAWMQATYWRMQGYSPFFDQALGWAPPSWFYLDLYALYRGQSRDEQLISEHPDWVLRDAQQNRLYIQFGCNGTSCTQYAADIGNPAWRRHWIEQARATMNRGYAGIFVDDMNLEMKVSNGAGSFVRPIDPRTGQPMTDADWRRYMAEFAEEIRAAFPDKEIVHNSLWWLDHSDPYVQRQVAAADYVEMERGFADGGLTGGTGQWSYDAYLAHVDWLHSRGAEVVFEPYGLNADSAMFELASYFLVSNGGDAMNSEYRADPGDWWPGWETELGSAQGSRYSWQGLRRRDFSGGIALVNDPGAPTRTVQLPSGTSWTNLDGQQVSSVTLGARRGAVLLADSPPSSDAGPGGPAGSQPGPSPSQSPGSGATPDASAPPTGAGAPTIATNKGKVRRGRHVVVSGSAAANRVAVEALIGGAWRVVAEDRSLDSGHYGVRIKLRTPGVNRLRAAAPGLPESNTVQVKVKR